MPAVAMTDQNNLFAMVKFYRAALTHGVKPIVGVDTWLFDPDADPSPGRLVLLCRDLDGYRRLSRLLTRAYLEGQAGGVPVLHRDWLVGEGTRGLLALSGGRDGAPGRALMNHHEDAARRMTAELQELFAGDYFLDRATGGCASYAG